MKVELDNLRLATTGILSRVVIGIPDKKGQSMVHQKDVTSDFTKAVIEMYGGFVTTLRENGEPKWELVCKEIPSGNPAHARTVPNERNCPRQENKKDRL